MVKPNGNFDGAKFARKYNLDPMSDFIIDASGYLQCPFLPELTAEDIADCVLDPPPSSVDERLEAAELMIDLLLDTQESA